MNAVAPAPVFPDTGETNRVREWIAELTDFTPQQIEAVLAQMEKQKTRSL